MSQCNELALLRNFNGLKICFQKLAYSPIESEYAHNDHL
jgi:hypothetical protein